MALDFKEPEKIDSLQIFMAMVRASAKNIFLRLDDCVVNYGLFIGVNVGF